MSRTSEVLAHVSEKDVAAGGKGPEIRSIFRTTAIRQELNRKAPKNIDIGPELARGLGTAITQYAEALLQELNPNGVSPLKRTDLSKNDRDLLDLLTKGGDTVISGEVAKLLDTEYGLFLAIQKVDDLASTELAIWAKYAHIKPSGRNNRRREDIPSDLSTEEGTTIQENGLVGKPIFIIDGLISPWRKKVKMNYKVCKDVVKEIKDDPTRKAIVERFYGVKLDSIESSLVNIDRIISAAREHSTLSLLLRSKLAPGIALDATPEQFIMEGRDLPDKASNYMDIDLFKRFNSRVDEGLKTAETFTYTRSGGSITVGSNADMEAYLKDIGVTTGVANKIAVTETLYDKLLPLSAAERKKLMQKVLRDNKAARISILRQSREESMGRWFQEKESEDQKRLEEKDEESSIGVFAAKEKERQKGGSLFTRKEDEINAGIHDNTIAENETKEKKGRIDAYVDEQRKLQELWTRAAAFGAHSIKEIEDKIGEKEKDRTQTSGMVPPSLFDKLKAFDAKVDAHVTTADAVSLKALVAVKAGATLPEATARKHIDDAKELFKRDQENLLAEVEQNKKDIGTLRELKTNILLAQENLHKSKEVVNNAQDTIVEMVSDYDEIEKIVSSLLSKASPTPTEILSCTMQQILEEANYLFATYPPPKPGWPAADNEMMKSRIVLAHAEARARESNPTLLTKSGNLAEAVTALNSDEWQVRIFTPQELLDILFVKSSGFNFILPSGGTVTGGALSAGDPTHIKMVEDIIEEANKHISDRREALSQRETLAKKAGGRLTSELELVDAGFAEERGRLGLMGDFAKRQADNRVRLGALNRSPDQYFDDTPVAVGDVDYTELEYGKPKGYLKLLDLIFDYQGRETDRDEYFRKISDLIKPDDMANLLQDVATKSGNPYGGTVDLPNMMVHMKVLHKDKKVSEIDYAAVLREQKKKYVSRAKAM